MKMLLDTYTKVIVHIGEIAETAPNGINVGSSIYANSSNYDIIDITNIPTDVKVQAYKYIDGQFLVNNDYKEPVNQNDVENLKAQNAQMIMALVQGGLM